MARTHQIERSISAGQLVALRFSQDAVAASQTNVDLPLTSGAGLTSISVGATGITIKDDDNAASTGTAVTVMPELNGVFGYLESTTAGNATAVHDLATGSVIVNDNNSPTGPQLYFDEDAASVDLRLMAVNVVPNDVFVPTTTGEFLRVVSDADAATKGVAVYFDDDAATVSERLMFVSPTNVDGTGATDNTVGLPWGSTTGDVATGVKFFEAPWDFEILAVEMTLSAAGSAGTLTINPTIAGTVKSDPGLSVTTETAKTDLAPRGSAEGVAGDAIGAQIDTDASWNGTTADLSVTVLVLMTLDGV